MKTLVVPVDFSPVSLNTLQYATQMAQAIGARILLVHAYEVPITYADIVPDALPLSEIQNASKDKLEAYKKDVLHLSSHQVPVETKSQMGDVVSVLENLCAAEEPFAIIMCSHQVSAMERWLMGSATLSAIKHIRYPVIVLPPGARYQPVERIGLACDFVHMKDSMPAAAIKNLVEAFHAELHFLHVNNEEEPLPEAPLETVYLEAQLGTIQPQYSYVNNDDITEGIYELAQLNKLDLLIIIPRKHSFTERILYATNTKELITHTPIPMAAIHEN